MSATPRNASSPLNDTVPYSATSVTIFNLVRDVVYRSVFNNTDKDLYLFFSASAATATTSATTKVAAGATFVFPTPVYNNVVTGIGAAAGTGSYNTTQFTL